MKVERKHRIAALSRLAALCALALAFAQPALAQGELAVAPQGSPLSASASITFRIVVRESVRIDDRDLVAAVAQADLRSPPQQRLVDELDGMQRVTLARP